MCEMLETLFNLGQEKQKKMLNKALTGFTAAIKHIDLLNISRRHCYSLSDFYRFIWNGYNSELSGCI